MVVGCVLTGPLGRGVVYLGTFGERKCTVNHGVTVRGVVCRQLHSSHGVSFVWSCTASRVRLSLLLPVKWAGRTCLVRGVEGCRVSTEHLALLFYTRIVF